MDELWDRNEFDSYLRLWFRQHERAVARDKDQAARLAQDIFAQALGDDLIMLLVEHGGFTCEAVRGGYSTLELRDVYVGQVTLCDTYRGVRYKVMAALCEPERQPNPLPYNHAPLCPTQLELARRRAYWRLAAVTNHPGDKEITWASSRAFPWSIVQDQVPPEHLKNEVLTIIFQAREALDRKHEEEAKKHAKERAAWEEPPQIIAEHVGEGVPASEPEPEAEIRPTTVKRGLTGQVNYMQPAPVEPTIETAFAAVTPSAQAKKKKR
jgi:hypothetical protein